MKTVYIGQIRDLRDAVLEHLKTKSLGNNAARDILSNKFFNTAREINSIEEGDLTDWVKGTSGDILYYGGLFKKDPKQYEDLLNEILDHLNSVLPQEKLTNEYN